MPDWYSCLENGFGYFLVKKHLYGPSSMSLAKASRSAAPPFIPQSQSAVPSKLEVQSSMIRRLLEFARSPSPHPGRSWIVIHARLRPQPSLRESGEGENLVRTHETDRKTI